MVKQPFSYTLSKILTGYIVWWVFWALVQTSVLHHIGLGWQMAVADAIVSNSLLAMAGFTLVIIYRFYRPGKGNRFYLVVFGVGITKLFSMAMLWLLQQLFASNPEYLHFLDKSAPIRFVFSLLIISFITVLSWLWGHMQEHKEHEQRRTDAEQLAKEAELAKLRQQLQPHFLFNSLNSISALAGSRPNEARKMIQQLSDFLRGTLKKDEQQLVKLSEELEHLALYLEIEKVRFGHRLHIDMQHDDKGLQAKLPPLLLQPIVENAIKFGLYDTTGDTTISISSRMEGSYLYIEIKNPFDPQTQQGSHGTGFGLSSVQRRLFLLFARQDLLSTEQIDHTFITKLKIPQSA